MSELGQDGQQSVEETLRIAKKYLKREIFCTPEGMVNYTVMAIETAEADLQRANDRIEDLSGESLERFYKCEELEAELLKRETDIKELMEFIHLMHGRELFPLAKKEVDRLMAKHEPPTQNILVQMKK